MENYRRERAALLAESGDATSAATQERLAELFSTRIEKYLDAGQGACWLARPEIADLVVGSLRYFDGQRYRLAAFSVMPNHVHVVVMPIGNHELSEILHSWKSYSENEANKRIGRAGTLWQKESYDHIVRDADDLEHTIAYVRQNPTHAGLKDWRWVWP